MSRGTTSPQPSFLSGHPSVAAIGSGIARTTGLRAIDGGSSGTHPDPTVRSRDSQTDESGTHTSGTVVPPAAWPTRFSTASCCPAMAAATPAESAAATFTDTHLSRTVGRVAVHRAAVAWIAGAISGAAAIDRLTFPPHRGLVRVR